MTIYRVCTLTKNAPATPGESITVQWFAERMVSRAGYRQTIRGYDPKHANATYVEGAVNESFTIEEARGLKRWLDDQRAGVTSIEPFYQDLAIDSNLYPTSWQPSGGALKRWDIRTPLDCDVFGLYDLRTLPETDDHAELKQRLKMYGTNPIHIDPAELARLDPDNAADMRILFNRLLNRSHGDEPPPF